MAELLAKAPLQIHVMGSGRLLRHDLARSENTPSASRRDSALC